MSKRKRKIVNGLIKVIIKFSMDIWELFQFHDEITPFLDLEVIKALSCASKSVRRVAEQHINLNYFFSTITPLISYRNARKVKLTIYSASYPKNRNLGEIFPAVTHLFFKIWQLSPNPDASGSCFWVSDVPAGQRKSGCPLFLHYYSSISNSTHYNK